MKKSQELWHEEHPGKGRRIAHKLTGPWLFDEIETLPELGGMIQRVQIGDFAAFCPSLLL